MQIYYLFITIFLFHFNIIFVNAILNYVNQSDYIEEIRNLLTDSILPPYKLQELVEWRYEYNIPSNPGHWPGEDGRGVEVPESGDLYAANFKKHSFNILASDRISLYRTVNDSRIPKCKKEFSDLLPTASIIIVFHNEAFSTLLRTVHSVINTSPNVLTEVILVDDASTKTYLRYHLRDYVRQFTTPVRILRQGMRSGLIKARLLGAAHAKGQVLIFLDAHCECNKEWLQPLLQRIAEDRTRVVAPIVDVIDENDFEYIPATDTVWGGFDWKFGFRWYSIPKRENDRRNNDKTLPIRTPTISGGLFAIDRDFFDYIGKYDEKMTIWGAENLEFSFRVWTCGGSLEIVPCSRVGHVFREESPYTLPGGRDFVVWHNTGRLADVWLDDYKDFYYGIVPGAKLIEHGDVTERIELRKQLNCKSFQWYIDNIFPESHLPRDYISLGDIRNLKKESICIDSMYDTTGKVRLNGCMLQHKKIITLNQLFLYTKQKQIMNDETCLEGHNVNEKVLLKVCHNNRASQLWQFLSQNGTILNLKNNLCLDTVIDEKVRRLILNQCDNKSDTQKWLINDNFQWHQFNHLQL